MKIYRLYTLRKSQVEAIYASLGGKLAYQERLRRDGIGSPFLYYLGGHQGIDELNERAADVLRISFEEFRHGLMLHISERTEPHIMPLLPTDVRKVSVELAAERVNPLPRSLFDRLLGWNLGLRLAYIFARPSEYEEARTVVALHTNQDTIRFWAPSPEYARVRKFFEKSQLSHLLEAAA